MVENVSIAAILPQKPRVIQTSFTTEAQTTRRKSEMVKRVPDTRIRTAVRTP
jgi:hypothetical protein